MKTIEVHINHLILHGFDRIDRHQVGAALQRELTRLIREQGLPSALSQARAIGNMNAGEFETGQSKGSNSVGTQAAQTVYRGMDR